MIRGSWSARGGGGGGIVRRSSASMRDIMGMIAAWTAAVIALRSSEGVWLGAGGWGVFGPSPMIAWGLARVFLGWGVGEGSASLG